jgi:microcystin-dependent protein
MSDPFLAEIRIFAGNFAPVNWATCDGQIMSISQNAALFSLIGTYYGGNGSTNFGLPNFGGSAAVAAGNGTGLTPRVIGEQGGETTVTLLTSEMPLHTHPLNAHGLAGKDNNPAGGVLAEGGTNFNLYLPTGTPSLMAPQAISAAGGSLAHNNVQPYIMFTFIICLRGSFPQRS